MEILLIAVCVALFVSAVCSLMEASLFAVPLAHVRYLADSGSRAGQVLLRFKEQMGKPISAILILNTVSHTVGAAVAGAEAARLYGETGVIVFSAVFTILILLFTEIVPKQIGVTHSKRVSLLIAVPLKILIIALYPIVLVTETISRIFGGHSEPKVSEEEVLSIAEIGKEEGVLDDLEGSVITNIIGLDDVAAKDVLTPRVVVFRLEDHKKVQDVVEDLQSLAHTRIPLYKKDEPDNVVSYVLQRDILRALLKGEKNTTLRSLSRPMTTVHEFQRVDRLLLQMFENGDHIISVVDEHGGFAGIVSLEDILEEVVGREIVDEYDEVEDMRSHARAVSRRRRRSSLIDQRNRLRAQIKEEAKKERKNKEK